MNKLTKGIKKKVKGKKKLTEDELQQEELRQYRLEKQNQAEKAQNNLAGEGSIDKNTASRSNKTPTKESPQSSEEWSKFNALTAGIDTALSSTKESLQHLKESSYYQRKKPQFEQSQLEATDVTSDCDEETTCENEETEIVEVNHQPSTEESRNSTSEDPVDVDELISKVESYERSQLFEEDIFNTDYVTKVTSGEINLAVIPDSPDEEDSKDPFDTTDVEKILEAGERKNRHKRITLGEAVAVLSGAEKNLLEDQLNATSDASKRRVRKKYRRPNSIDPIDDIQIEASPQTQTNTVESKSQASESLLDSEIAINSETTSDVFSDVIALKASPVINKTECVPTQECDNSSKLDIKIILSEFEDAFESSSQKETLEGLFDKTESESDEKDEFDHIAAESLTKTEDRKEFIDENDDPFDTSFAAIYDGKFEDVVNEVKPFEANFTSEEEERQQYCHQSHEQTPHEEKVDFLTSVDVIENCDYCIQVTHLHPSKSNQNEEVVDEIDPFDTSAAENIGQVELKLLEQELLCDEKTTTLSSRINTIVQSDGALPQLVNSSEVTKSTDVDVLINEVIVTNTESNTDLLSNPTADSHHTFIEENDPFDTSIAADLVESTPRAVLDRTSTISIKDIENLNQSAVLNPEESVDYTVSESHEEIVELKPPVDYITSTPTDEVSAETLIPQRVDFSPVESDPFDTSYADKFGQHELKLIESEIEQEASAAHVEIIEKTLEYQNRIVELKKITESVPDSIRNLNKIEDVFDTNLEDQNPILEPQNIADDEDFCQLQKDPFDTSIADKFGEVELKAIEAEFAEKTSDTDRSGANKIKQLHIPPVDLFVSEPKQEETDSVLTPEKVSSNIDSPDPFDTTFLEEKDDQQDPFDTTIAEKYGTTELKLIEKEFIE